MAVVDLPSRGPGLVTAMNCSGFSAPTNVTFVRSARYDSTTGSSGSSWLIVTSDPLRPPDRGASLGSYGIAPSTGIPSTRSMSAELFTV